VVDVALVRYGLLRHSAEFLPRERDLPSAGEACVVETPRGIELGTTLAVVARDEAPRAGVLLRAASDDDERRQRDLDADRSGDVARAQALAGEDAHVVGAERLLDDERLIVYYTAEGRVDVPDLLSDLRETFGRAVTLTHLGVRQRARIVGGCGPCGRELCCSTFLREMQPVPIRFARVQGLDLEPERTAGRCGRLKCCLRYENPHYEDLRRGLPRIGWEVRTRRVEGEVLAVDVLHGRVLVRPEHGRARAVFNEEIEHASPPKRGSRPGSLPLAGEDSAEASEEADSSWSQIARRLWRRFRDGDAPDPEESHE
jgi:cell fate regulator YaaT (PSP1 superfamily)